MVVFHQKAKYILISNGIFNQILVQTLVEDFFGSTIVLRVLLEYRCPREAEYLRIGKEVDNIFVALTEMATMTLIENHDDARLPHFIQTLAVPLLRNGCIEFLNGSDNDFRIA